MEPRTSLWIRLALLVALAVGVVWLLAPLGAVVQVVLLGALLAYLLDPLANRLEARGMGRTAAAALVFVGLLALLVGPVVVLAPALSEQVQSLQEFDVSQAIVALERIEAWMEARLAPLGVGELDLQGRAAAFAAAHVADALNVLPGVLGLLVQLVMIPFVAFLLLRDGRRFRKGFISLVPNRYFEFTLNVLHKADEQLGGYLRGQLLCATVVAMLSIVALWLLGVEYYVLVGIVAGLANLIPFLGPAIGALTAIAVDVATTGGFDKVLPIVVAFAIIQTIDNVGTQPVLLSRNVELHPLVILIVLLIANQIFGFLGLLLAVPAAAMVKVFVQETVTTLRRYRFS
ncbi:MAG: AI-2E family transporter [Rhodothermales bacterium]|nr:AI-2E family transporter [Rhodothermales bacterium]